MRMLARLFVAFCVATILAQAIIVGLAGARGNLSKETILKSVALINGIDISGDQLKRMLDEAREQPVPTYEDVRDARAREGRNLEMRESSVRRMQQQITEMQNELKTKLADFDRRKDEFYNLLEQKEKDLLDESLKEVQRTIETLSPEQAKEQLLKLFEADGRDDVVAIIKEMSSDKRKKILAEFTDPEGADQLHQIIKLILAGEPTASLIRDARQQQQTQ